MTLDRPIDVLTVCGVGMGSSLMLKMTAQDALRGLGVEANVECVDVSTARSMRPDVLLGQEMHTSELPELAPVTVTVSDFLDADALQQALREKFTEQGWL